MLIGFSISVLAVIGLEASQQYPSPDGVRMQDGQLLGGDFVAFYTGGSLFRDDRQLMYDVGRQRAYQAELFGPEAYALVGELPFIYPPLVAAALAPVSRLPFDQAFYLWSVLGLLASLGSLIILMTSSDAARAAPVPLLLLFTFAFVPYTYQTLFGGQASWIGVVILSLAITALLRDRDHLAGAILSLSYYKPPLFIFLLVVLLLARRRDLAIGFAVGAVTLTAATLLVMGLDGFVGYLASASQYTYGREVAYGVRLPAEQGMGLWALGYTLSSSMTFTAAVLAVPVVITGWTAYRLLRSEVSADRRYGLVLATTATLAFSVQLINYDLALLLIPMALALPWALRRPLRDRWVLLLFVGFFLEARFRELDVGGRVVNASSVLFAVLVTGLVVQGWRIIRQSSTAIAPAAAPE